MAVGLCDARGGTMRWTSFVTLTASIIILGAMFPAGRTAEAAVIGREVAVSSHLHDGDEYGLTIPQLIRHGLTLFVAQWTDQEGGGRPLSKGTGAPLTDPNDPLMFPRNFNRISAPDANSCAGCHNKPGPGGGGDIVANVFVLGQRFDFATFGPGNPRPLKGSVDEEGRKVTLNEIANSRATLGMFGSGYIEMLARQMTADLQVIRNSIPPGGSAPLVTKGVSFGVLSRAANGTWNVAGVEGLPATSLITTGASNPPNLILRPFHQSGSVVSVRQFTNNAYNHHHGMQPEERVGAGKDADGDGFINELTRADITAATIFQIAMAVPGRVIPNNPEIEAAVSNGERKFGEIGCTSCHIPSLPLYNKGWIYTEPNPYNPEGNLRPGDAQTLRVDLNSPELPGPRLRVRGGVVYVPAFTDLKLHDITNGPDDPNREELDLNQPPGSEAFFAGNGKFITRKLWGTASEPPFFHHGKYTTFRESILAHSGEALASRMAFEALGEYDQGSIVEFLKTLKVLPAGTRDLVVDENGRAKYWPSAW